ncbi:MAG: carboxypeptidase-like regulatory domain-containing protein, partial [Flavobacterium sp.]
MRKFFLSITLVMFSLISLAQTGSTLQGKVVDAKTLSPMESVVVTIQNTTLLQVTGRDGQFFFPDVPAGKQFIFIKSEGYVDQLLEIEISPTEGFDLGEIILEYDLKDELQLALVVLTENDLADDQGGGDNTAGLLQSSRDVFQQTAAFNWGQAWFRIRGLDNELATTMINGVVMNKVQNGRPQFNNWGGLNDVTRLQEFTMGSAASDYNFGTILGTQEINTRASLFRGGNRVTFSGTNTNYNWRAMATHASGMNEKGWAYVFSGSRRWAQEANFPGT